MQRGIHDDSSIVHCARRARQCPRGGCCCHGCRRKDSTTTNIGTLDRRRPRRCFRRAAVLALRGRNLPPRPYFGDTHTHTSFSMDAGASARGWPKDAYRFAKGEDSSCRPDNGQALRRWTSSWSRTTPTASAVFPQLIGGDPSLLATPRDGNGITRSIPARARRRRSTSSPLRQRADAERLPNAGPPAYRSAWRETIKAADERTSPAASPRSSVMSGRRTPAETISPQRYIPILIAVPERFSRHSVRGGVSMFLPISPR